MPSFNTVNGFDFGLVGLYLGIVVWVGFYCARRNRTSGDFFRAGGQVPWFMAGVSTWMAGFTGFMFVAAAGVTYRNGASALILFTAAFWGYLGGYFIFAPLWRRARLQAPLDFLTRRFSPGTTRFYAVCQIPLQILPLGNQFYILAFFLSATLGIDRLVFTIGPWSLNGLQLCILALGLTVVLYTIVGGLWAAVLTDSVQGVIVTVMTLMMFPLALRYLGSGHPAAGWHRLWSELPPAYLQLRRGDDYASGWFIGAYLAINFLTYNVQWHLAQRYNAVPGERDARKMAMLCAWLSLAGPLLWILPVMGARVVFPHLATQWPQYRHPEEASFVSMALLLLPHGMIGFVVAAIISGSLGYANDAMNWLSSAVARDVVAPLRLATTGRPLSDRGLMRVAQGAMLMIGLAGIALALAISGGGGAFAFVLQYASFAIGCFSMPVALSLVYRRTPWWSGLASCLATILVAVPLGIAGVWPAHGGYERNAIVSLVVPTVVFFVSARWYREEDPRNAEILRLDRDLRTPVEPDGKTVYGALPMYRVIGAVAIGLGGVMAACAALPSRPESPAWINGVAGVILIGIGLALRRMARASGAAAATLLRP